MPKIFTLGMIGKWKCLHNKTQTRLHQLQELRHISDGIRGVSDDLETLGSIVLDDDDEDDHEDDYELVHMRHQLHEVYTKIIRSFALHVKVVSLIKFAKFLPGFSLIIISPQVTKLLSQLD